MPPFRMPKFYMPFPARLNPHQETARAHSKAWADRMGLLGPEQQAWDEDSFDADDYASFSAWNYPYAPVNELNLVTDWHVWGFFLDDGFVAHYDRDSDPREVQRFLDRLAALMPTFGPSSVVPENPLERALADLWPRTAYTKSPDWRRRFSRNVRAIAESAVLEMSNVASDHIPDPVSYTVIRRETGGMEFSACLVEHARGVEVPSGVDRTRAIRVLKDACADSDLWRNDIVSFEREVDEGQTNNGVLVLQQVLGGGLQEAVDRVNDLVTSRLRQFEHTAAVELPELFDRLQLDPVSRSHILSYVEGLEDWMAGDLQWTMTTGRYGNAASTPPRVTTTAPGEYDLSWAAGGPSGLGTAGTRIPSLTM
ncbi:terpene synthase family protein [Actinophytocola sediminis]